MQKFWDWLGAKLIEWLERSSTRAFFISVGVWLLYAYADGLFASGTWDETFAQFLAATIAGNVGGILATKKK
jgi:hypothetical protein